MSKSIIFDMDGVISDTQDLHAKAIATVLKADSIHITPDDVTRRFAGMPVAELFITLFREAKKSCDSIDAEVAKYSRLVTISTHGHIKAVPGTLEFIAKLYKKNIPMAVASSSGRAYINMVLSELNIKKFFKAIASGQDVSNGKPAPDIFLLAAQRLDAKPQDCIVIEDGINGMIGAKQAGMFCVGLARWEAPENCPADVVVDDLNKLNRALFE
ncbi:HAD family phosphatase [Candidatus Uhrbacteria bacterium]|nr:HAD family phosphatase [Candidatus Uhrbacteria bacterium]